MIKTGRMITAGGLCLIAGTAANAQDATSGVVRDTIPMVKPGSPLIVWGVAAAFLIGCLAIAFKNSKRISNQ